MKRRIIVLVILISIINSCDIYDSGPSYVQFTSDDLCYLIFDRDSLTLKNDFIEYHDTVSYLYNDSLEVSVPIYTIIKSELSNPDLFGNFHMDAYSRYKFNNCPGFESANSYINRHGDSGSAQCHLEVWSKSASWSVQFLSKDAKLTVDTAIVLGELYNDVYKFKPSLNNRNMSTIYFAKKYGYIKIETLDGNSIQRISK